MCVKGVNGQKGKGEVIEEVRRKKGDGVGRRRGIHKGVPKNFFSDN